ncbi:dipeptidase [Deinococcus sonorensis]|uniref:Membrane dipeptidase n=2 Tax=Deinococcus sonorensis TaxID=309891 RepID=A0AAU7UAX5_9DEIO
MRVFDAHLDLAYNAGLGRDLTLSLSDLRAQDPVAGETACVTFSELQRAGVAACFATLFAAPAGPETPLGYETWQGARRQAVAQLDQYRRWEDQGHVRLLRSGTEVREHVRDWDDTRPLGVVLLMEGADPLRDAGDLPEWVDAGVRLIGPAWRRTRYAGGTDEPGPLTDRGEDLLVAMRELGVALDASHLDDASFWQAIELQPLVMASHSNSRALVPGNRHLSDDMARAIFERGGVVGLVAPSMFIRAGWAVGDTRASASEWAAHAEHYAQLGSWRQVGLGTDLDGGFGIEKGPDFLNRYADVLNVLDALPEAERPRVAGGNWLRWIERNLK